SGPPGVSRRSHPEARLRRGVQPTERRRAVSPTGHRVADDRLRPPVLCLVTDGQRGRSDLVARVAAAVEGGVTLVQVREQQRPASELLDLVLALRERIAGRAALVVNDRLDVALTAGADGVHLPAT